MQQVAWQMQMNNGQIISMDLSYLSLYQLRETGAKEKGIYEKYMEIYNKQTKDEIDNAYILYTAYVCANRYDKYMDFLEFLQNMPSDRLMVVEALEALWYGKKKQA